MFDGVSFGKMYRTRNGKKAVFVGYCNDGVWMLVEGDMEKSLYSLEGVCKTQHNERLYGAISNKDIVTEWICENELDNIAYDVCHDRIKGEMGYVDDDIYVLERGFKCGVRYALGGY